LVMSIPNEGYLRKASCVLNSISMVLFQGKTNNKSFTDWFENNQMA
jgi:hypothetical protein